MGKDTKFLTNNGWNQKMIRLRKEYCNLCIFLDFFANEQGRSSLKIYDEITNYSLDKLFFDGFHYEYTGNYTGQREPKGLLLSKGTQEKFKKEYEIYAQMYERKFHKKITSGIFMELLIFIYCMNNFEKKHKDYIDMDWGFVDLRDGEN